MRRESLLSNSLYVDAEGQRYADERKGEEERLRHQTVVVCTPGGRTDRATACNWRQVVVVAQEGLAGIAGSPPLLSIIGY